VRAMSGTTCLLTGATSGIGKETALRLAMLSATVVIVARDAARSAAAAAEITGRVPLAQVEVMTADLSSLAQVRRLAGDVLGRHGRLDVLVNNVLVGSARQMADTLLRRRDRAAVSYVSVNAMFTEQFAPVIELLANA
jgi:retinol dehydrogenase 12